MVLLNSSFLPVKINLGSKIEIEVEIFLIFVLRILQVQKAISYDLNYMKLQAILGWR